MNNQIIRAIAVALLLAAGICWAAQCEKTCQSPKSPQDPNVQPDPVDAVLKQLNDRTLQLTYYEAIIEYKTIQPLYESEAIRKGALYYAKFGEKSRLRINFQTLKQDDEKEEKYIEQYIFDGTWLTQINYQIKTVRKYQLTEPNKPVDAFDVASNKIPLIGFAKTENLKKDFDISLVDSKSDQPATFFQLHLNVKPNSTYKDDYVCLDFWVDKKLRLPTKIIALSTEQDIYEIRLLKPKIDEKIDKKVFDFTIPRGFGEPEIIRLEKKEE
ncbi:MAG: hypothetical protein JXN61_00445 [Sedimentisphaerales bacterium]|nr:hypothetical protein [Sedimentisphaerales bacterium]